MDGQTLPPPNEFAGQEHLVCKWNELNSTDQEKLLKDVQNIDAARLARIFEQSTSPGTTSQAPPVPVTEVCDLNTRDEEDVVKWKRKGLELIAGGKLGVLLLAGGQGTRLGSTNPKGCYDIGLPSRKSLFQLQAERIIRAQCLAQETMTRGRLATIPWYIMTSEFTDEATKKFFEDRSYFGLSPDQVMFFQQGTLPCVTGEGQIILEARHKIARAPDGNGGVYAAMEDSGCLADLERRGVEYVECFSVDNALVRVGDPVFLGYCAARRAMCAAKVVKKAYPEERVGVFVHRGEGGAVEVVEYSELDPALAASVDEATGHLRFNWSNVCMHLFSRIFLQAAAAGLRRDCLYHVARKKIPSMDGPVDGIKLEQFIFDAFRYAPSVALFEVAREDEFAPVKNGRGSAKDSPDTARRLLLDLHTRWVVAAGGEVLPPQSDEPAGVEVSSLLSLGGEGLIHVCKNRSFKAFTELK